MDDFLQEIPFLLHTIESITETTEFFTFIEQRNHLE